MPLKFGLQRPLKTGEILLAKQGEGCLACSLSRFIWCQVKYARCSSCSCFSSSVLLLGLLVVLEQAGRSRGRRVLRVGFPVMHAPSTFLCTFSTRYKLLLPRKKPVFLCKIGAEDSDLGESLVPEIISTVL